MIQCFRKPRLPTRPVLVLLVSIHDVLVRYFHPSRFYDAVRHRGRLCRRNRAGGVRLRTHRRMRGKNIGRADRAQSLLRNTVSILREEIAQLRKALDEKHVNDPVTLNADKHSVRCQGGECDARKG